MKERLDHILWKYGYVESIDKAKRLVMLGHVIVDGKKIEKPGTGITVSEELNIRIKGNMLPYVSRGGLKLKKALDAFQYSMQGRRVLDVGASTGGFTDCALQAGASFVYALDVGTNQLAWKLRIHPQVKSIEQCHVKDLTWEHLDAEAVDSIVMDVSFISACGIFKLLFPFLKEEGTLILLVKPQFEVDNIYLQKGIVHSLEAHQGVLERVFQAAEQEGFFTEKLEVSPILGGKGNVEYLVGFRKEKPKEKITLMEILDKAKVLGGLE